MAAYRRQRAGTRVVLERGAFPPQGIEQRELAPDFMRQQDALLIEQRIAFLHQPLLILELEQRDARGRDLTSCLRHAALR